MVSYSVLMSVYSKERPEHLRQSMDSMWDQTVPTDDFVLVCDGPLGEELNRVVQEMQTRYEDRLRVVRLEENGGLGPALNCGLSHCRYPLVARMDSDDIARPDRCEKQLRVFREQPQVSIVGGIVEEFSPLTGQVTGRRVPPDTQQEIRSFAKRRNPFNHPCVMYRKAAVEAAGGYRARYLLEDYDLWVRMLMNGAEGYNLQEPLLWMRAGEDLYRRRSGRKYAVSQAQLFHFMREQGLISGWECAVSVAVRGAAALLPNGLRTMLFQMLLRTQRCSSAVEEREEGDRWSSCT